MKSEWSLANKLKNQKGDNMVKIVGSFEVNDWAHWKSGFDNHAEAREKASIKTIYVGNEIDNPNMFIL